MTVKKKFCLKGHLMSETRESYGKGDSHCRICSRNNSSNYRKKYPEMMRKSLRKSILKRFYGLSVKEYDERLKKNKGVCEICGKKNKGVDKRTGFKRRLCVDHDHRTKKIRGLLCSCCNTAIGLLAENPVLFSKVIIYLKRWKMNKQ
jgi:hypothetical protein